MSISTPPKSSLSYTPPKVFTQAVRSMHTRRNAPPPIPIPVNPIRNDIKMARRRPETLTMVAIELSDYPPSLTRHDVVRLFKEFVISPDFMMATNIRFAYPLRVLIWVNGRDEAERAVKELNGKTVGSRQIRVALVEQASHEQKEVVVAELADELKIAIISMMRTVLNQSRISLTSPDAAHTYYPHLTQKIVEVREHVGGKCHYAFLQTRDPATYHTESGGVLSSATNTAVWELDAGGYANDRGSQGKGKNGRLAALKSLQETVETQGFLHSVWGQWNGSCSLEPVV
ncbi:hypothetical protein DE146DRAFT_671695 [Phaeosphaeria sp. MPI-PUGE-AT-0046c]|nr:hypothetical protein DE146DRAFT_671695 [Phaeosphaeria sp. MPI-PUGE-AT-0046c]